MHLSRCWTRRRRTHAIACYRRNGFEFDGAEQTNPMMPTITDVR